MIRPQSKQLKIGWISPTIGTFGAIREMIEVSNVLIERGHLVNIYHPDGSECKWLKSLAICRKLADLRKDSLDVLIGIVDWQPELYNNLLQANAKVKAICLLGFSPTEEMAQALKGKTKAVDEAQRIILDSMRRKFLILADSSWQVKWVKKNIGYDAGPSFGGVNLRMFFPKEKISQDKIKIIYSGDPRERKGTDTVEKAIELIKNESNLDIEFDCYWGKKFPQNKLVEFIQEADIFLDGHRRAGWCNPVAEAIACGTVPVATKIGANEDFALHEKTALLVDINDYEAMAAEAIRLIENPELRNTLRSNGIRYIQNFSYEKVVPILEETLKKKVHDTAQQV